MLKKNFNYFTMFATGFFFCVLGLSFIFDSLAVWNWLYFTFVIGVSIAGIIKLFNIIINYRRLSHKGMQFLDLLVWAIAVILSLTIPKTFFALLPRLIGCWILLHAIIKIIVFYIRIKDHLPFQVLKVFYLCGDLIMAFYLLVNPGAHEEVISFFIGAYFFIYGGNTLLDLLREVLPHHSGDRLDQQLQLSIPPVLSAIIPPHLMSTLLDKDKEDEIQEHFDAIKKDIPVDLEVLIHLAPSGPAMFGHADMIYRGFVISYGCYDPHNRHLVGTLGDGVVIIAPKDTYIHNCLENENKTLISFGLSLHEEQKQRLNKRLLEVFSTFVDFESDEQLKQKGLPYQGECDDYLSRVTRTSPQARYYKIKEGKLKTFFVVSSNCVYFLANMLSSVGLNLFDLSGIISPGAYYDFLNKQFKSHKGFIISRHLYRKKDAYLFAPEGEVDTSLHEVIKK